MEEGDEKVEIIKSTAVAVASFVTAWGELTIAGISLVVAVIALVRSSKAEKLQSRVNAMEIKIKEYELERIEKEKEEATSSCVEARVIAVGERKYRLKVWNSGNTKVYGVTAKFEGDPGIFIMEQEKQPFDELDPGKNYELVILPYGQHASKFKIVTEWTDASGVVQTKTQMGDI